MSNLKIGDKVNFVLGTSLLTGTITKFYKNPYDEDECSVKTEVRTYSHILLHRVSKIEDNQIFEEKDTQIVNLQHKLEVSDKALEVACKLLQDYYCLDCCATTRCSREERCEKPSNKYSPRKFKEQVEKGIKGEKNENI